MKQIIFTGIIVGLVQMTVFAQIVPLSLKEAQDYALKNAFQSKNANYDIEVAALQTEELIGIGLPQIDGSVQYQNYINLPTQLVPAEFFGGEPGEFAKLQFGTSNNITVGLSASQLLFNGSWLVGLEAARSYASLKQKQKVQTEKQLLEDVAKAYHLGVIAGDNLTLLTKSREVLNKTFTDTKALYDVGFAEEQDVEQIQLSLNDLDNRIAYAEQQTKLTTDLLKFQIGMPLATEVQLTDNSSSLLTSATIEMLSVPFSADMHIDYQVSIGALGMQELNVKNERSKRLPSLGAFYNLQTNAQRNEFNFFDTSEPWFPIQLWGIQLNVPIFSGLSRDKAIGKARVEVQRITDMTAMTREGLQLEYNSAKTEYSYALQNYNSTRDNMQLAERILDKMRVKYSEGLSSSFEVSQSQAQALQAQGSYVAAMLNLLNAKIRLSKALSQL
ncbi:MAG: TolC family protein [Flavobacteriales bacterium]|nr:TolC family protein [Flavobacteriales bacterium]